MRRVEPGRPCSCPQPSWSSAPFCSPATAAGRADEPFVAFTDVTASSRIDFKHEASPTTQKYLVETMGGGVAVLDYDDDGWLDVFFTNGARLLDPMPAGVRPDKSQPRFANRLYRNARDGTFTDVTAAVGLLDAEGYAMGVATGDYDNDGRVDLYVTNLGGNLLYRNLGGRFEDVTARAGAAVGGWSSSAAFLDYDADGYLDLFVCRYVDWSFEANPYCGEKRPGYREYCHPRTLQGHHERAPAQPGRRPLRGRLRAGPVSTAWWARPWEWPSPTWTATVGRRSTWPTTRSLRSS